MGRALIFITIIVVYTILNIIIGIRIQKSLTISKTKSKIIFWILFMFICMSFIIANFFEYVMPYSIVTIIDNIGCYYLGLFVYILILFIISFFLTRIFKKGRFDYYSISLVLAAIISIYGFYEAHSTKITNYDVKIDSKIENSDSLKIALVSDLHLGLTANKNSMHKMVTETNELNPDIIIIAGDLIDGNLDIVLQQNSLSELSSLNSKYGTYFVLGNHDCYTEKVEELSNVLRENNINVLNDECTLVSDSFYIIGRVDKSIIYDQNAKKDAEHNTNNLSSRNKLCDIISGIDKTKPTILIDHSPNSIKESTENDIDLQLSGHTHNGQLFPFNFIVKKTAEVAYGYDKFNNTNIIVSSGFGTWGPQMRTNSQREIALINLHN